jgi:MYXO-CTERM domain-containing protein
VGTCDDDWGDCNLLPVDGCESSLSGADHCGTCGNACDQGEGCVQTDSGWDCSPVCPDADGDGFADEACGGADCNDNLITVNPLAEDIPYDGQDQDCDGSDLTDVDGDGHDAVQAGGEDCDDTDADIHPGARELCGDGIDQDCVGGDLSCTCIDADKDGFADEACGGTDCDDNDPDIRPLAVEMCDGKDNNCNGRVDEDHACDLGEDGCGCAVKNGDPLSLLGLLLLGLLLRRRR